MSIRQPVCRTPSLTRWGRETAGTPGLPLSPSETPSSSQQPFLLAGRSWDKRGAGDSPQAQLPRTFQRAAADLPSDWELLEGPATLTSTSPQPSGQAGVQDKILQGQKAMQVGGGPG